MPVRFDRVTIDGDAAVLRPLDLGREVTGRPELERRRQRVRDLAQRERLRREDLPDRAGREVPQLAERRRVERRRAHAGRAEHGQPLLQLARRLVGEGDGHDLRGANAPLATCCAMRRVIVVVLPEPAPARMQTGPRTASAARRCSGFRPSSGSTRPRYRGPARSHKRNERRRRRSAVELFGETAHSAQPPRSGQQVARANPALTPVTSIATTFPASSKSTVRPSDLWSEPLDCRRKPQRGHQHDCRSSPRVRS